MARLLAVAVAAAITGFLYVTAEPGGLSAAGGPSDAVSGQRDSTAGFQRLRTTLRNKITVVDSSGRVRSPYSSLAIGADGLPAISYYRSGHLRVLHCGNLACSRGNTIRTVDRQPGVGYSSSIAIGADGLPLISYGSDPGAGEGSTARIKQHLKVAHCGNSKCSRGTTITTVDKHRAVGYQSSVAIGADKLPLIVYLVYHNGLKVLHCGKLACTSGNTGTSVARAESASMVIGADRLPLIVYPTQGAGVRVLHCGNRACREGNRTVVIGGYWSTSLTIGRDGLPLIGYFDDAGLNVLHCGNFTCRGGNTITTVVRQGADVAGADVAIAIGHDGRPLLAYRTGADESQLTVLHCGNRICSARNSSYIAARLRLIAGRLSLAVGADRLPLISYVDSTKRNLVVLHCGNTRCRP